MQPLTIAVAGRTGQIARALERHASARGIAVRLAGRPELQIDNIDSVARFLEAARPHLLVNAAAYTAVDRAESEPELAYRANALGPENLARRCAELAIPMLHVSTDYVFDGTKATPYVEDDPIGPLGVYGASKAAGEAAVRARARRHLIVRTSWVYGWEGTNFVKTMLRLGQERPVLSVVGDQKGSPTSADDIAAAILDLAPRLVDPAGGGVWGTYHMTGGGVTTWHGLAGEVFRLAARAGLKVPEVRAITTAEYPTAARRPANSALDNSKLQRTFAIRLPDWQYSLEPCVERLVADLKRGQIA